MTDYQSVHRVRLDSYSRIDDAPKTSVLMRGVMFLAFWLVALLAPLAFAIFMFSLERM